MWHFFTCKHNQHHKGREVQFKVISNWMKWFYNHTRLSINVILNEIVYYNHNHITIIFFKRMNRWPDAHMNGTVTKSLSLHHSEEIMNLRYKGKTITHLYFRVKCICSKFKSNLIISFTSCTMGYILCILLSGHFNHCPENQISLVTWNQMIMLKQYICVWIFVAALVHCCYERARIYW